jgi:hypothetical protein
MASVPALSLVGSRPRRSRLLRTRNAATLLNALDHYLASGGSKAATARALHLRRQPVHQRLARVA